MVLHDGAIDNVDASKRIRIANKLIDTQALGQDQTLVNSK